MRGPNVDGEQADSIADDYAERVLRNEGRLGGLESRMTQWTAWP